jgi:SET domain-containing protein 6
MAAIWRSPVGRTQAGQDVRVFRSWCKKRKVLWDSCDIQETTTTGRAVVAAQDIAQDAVVVEVPDDAVLMGENCSIADALAGEGVHQVAAQQLPGSSCRGGCPGVCMRNRCRA